jgi:uncharacterized membrane protein YeaQ/YmgE (transglycosylase-associated protein family)
MATILAWIVIGGVAGWLASILVEGGGYGIVGDIVVGIVGALIGGFLSQTLFGGPGFTGFDITSLIVAFIGACILLFVLRLVSRGRYNRTHV